MSLQRKIEKKWNKKEVWQPHKNRIGAHSDNKQNLPSINRIYYSFCKRQPLYVCFQTPLYFRWERCKLPKVHPLHTAIITDTK